MRYWSLYDSLIEQAFAGTWGYSGLLEKHHVIPLSMGGRDSPSNWCYVPIRIHYILHLILVRQGHIDQIFAVELIARRLKRPLPRWARRLLNKRKQQLFREANRERLLGV